MTWRCLAIDRFRVLAISHHDRAVRSWRFEVNLSSAVSYGDPTEAGVGALRRQADRHRPRCSAGQCKDLGSVLWVNHSAMQKYPVIDAGLRASGETKDHRASNSQKAA